MPVKGNKVFLSAVEEESTEQLRSWRNDPELRKYFREYKEISKTMQIMTDLLKWNCQTLPSSPIYLIRLSTRPIIVIALNTKTPASINRFCFNSFIINLYDCYC